MMKVFIRVDASDVIGTGHMFRTLVLAEGLRALSDDVTFLCRDLPYFPSKRITDLGFRLSIIPPADSLSGELPLIQEKIAREQPDWIIIDHYDIKKDYYLYLRRNRIKILSIDDINHTRFPVDVLLNQNVNAFEHKYQCEKETIQLLGTQYALVREIYRQKRKQATIRDSLKKVLIFMGGSDPDNQTLKVLNALTLSRRKVDADIVLGPAFQHKDMIEKEASRNGIRYSIHQNLDHLADVMLRTDLAIGAGGLASLEMATMKLPMILMPIADNQRQIAQCLHEKGAAINAGWFKNVDEQHIAKILTGLSLEKVNQMSRIASRLCDGEGVNSVLEIMDSVLQGAK